MRVFLPSSLTAPVGRACEPTKKTYPLTPSEDAPHE
jgi:hypothetical protein